MTKKKLTVMRYVVMFLVGGVLIFEAMMVAKEVLGDRVEARPIAIILKTM